jgi:hypothetical protein
VLQAIATGQVATSGTAVTPPAIQSAPFVVRVRLDDTAFANRLPAGATGTAAIFTEHIKPAHVIRRVLQSAADRHSELRQSILNGAGRHRVIRILK